MTLLWNSRRHRPTCGDRRPECGVGAKYLGVMGKSVLLTVRVSSECIHTSRCIQLYALQFSTCQSYLDKDARGKEVTQCGRWWGGVQPGGMKRACKWLLCIFLFFSYLVKGSGQPEGWAGCGRGLPGAGFLGATHQPCGQKHREKGLLGWLNIRQARWRSQTGSARGVEAVRGAVCLNSVHTQVPLARGTWLLQRDPDSGVRNAPLHPSPALMTSMTPCLPVYRMTPCLPVYRMGLHPSQVPKGWAPYALSQDLLEGITPSCKPPFPHGGENADSQSLWEAISGPSTENTLLSSLRGRADPHWPGYLAFPNQ